MNRLFKKQQDLSNNYTSIIFNLDENFNVDIKFLWPDIDDLTIVSSKELARNYAALISIINLGGFKSDIVKILLESQQKTDFQSDKKFIGYILQYLAESDKLKNTPNSPIILPTKVFKKYE